MKTTTATGTTAALGPLTKIAKQFVEAKGAAMQAIASDRKRG